MQGIKIDFGILEPWRECIFIRESSRTDIFLLPSLAELETLFSGEKTWNVGSLCCSTKNVILSWKFWSLRERHISLHAWWWADSIQAVWPRMSSEIYTVRWPWAQHPPTQSKTVGIWVWAHSQNRRSQCCQKSCTQNSMFCQIAMVITLFFWIWWLIIK